MNQPHSELDGAAADDKSLPELDLGRLTETTGGAVRYALFAPLHYEPGYAYPLVVWLHGAGDSERQLRRIMPELSMRNYVAVAPRGTRRAAPESTGYDWGTTPEDVAHAAHSVFTAIDAASDRYHIARHRIFLAGFGTGGTMAFAVGLSNPDSFAGILSLSGPFPATGRPLADLRRCRQLPLFLAYGRHSSAFSPEQCAGDLRLLHAGGFSATLREYPGQGELTAQLLRDVNEWMMEIVTGAASPACDDWSSPL